MSDLSRCDVAVVGAGPAGATAAYLLARHGYNVRLIDKRHFPRPKLCAGLLTWKTMELISAIFGPCTDELTKKRIITHACRDYRIFRGPKEIARGCLDFPFHFVDRPAYDHHWLQMAQAMGAQTLTGRAVTAVDADSGAIDLADGSRLQAGLIIGADGAWSKVRQALPQAQKV